MSKTGKPTQTSKTEKLRRRLLASAGGAVAVSSIISVPKKWQKGVITSTLLPAHAQSTGNGGGGDGNGGGGGMGMPTTPQGTMPAQATTPAQGTTPEPMPEPTPTTTTTTTQPPLPVLSVDSYTETSFTLSWTPSYAGDVLEYYSAFLEGWLHVSDDGTATSPFRVDSSFDGFSDSDITRIYNGNLTVMLRIVLADRRTSNELSVVNPAPPPPPLPVLSADSFTATSFRLNWQPSYAGDVIQFLGRTVGSSVWLPLRDAGGSITSSSPFEADASNTAWGAMDFRNIYTAAVTTRFRILLADGRTSNEIAVVNPSPPPPPSVLSVDQFTATGFRVTWTNDQPDDVIEVIPGLGTGWTNLANSGVDSVSPFLATADNTIFNAERYGRYYAGEFTVQLRIRRADGTTSNMLDVTNPNPPDPDRVPELSVGDYTPTSFTLTWAPSRAGDVLQFLAPPPRGWENVRTASATVSSPFVATASNTIWSTGDFPRIHAGQTSGRFRILVADGRTSNEVTARNA